MEIASGFSGCGAVQVNKSLGGDNPVAIPDGTTTPAANAIRLLEVNKIRQEVIIQNAGIVVIYLGLGFPPSPTSYTVALLPCGVAHDGTGGIYTSDIWQGTIFAIAGGANGLLALTEEV